jgi:hypothetical protein
MAVSDRPSTKVERASARLIRSPLAQTVIPHLALSALYGPMLTAAADNATSHPYCSLVDKVGQIETVSNDDTVNRLAAACRLRAVDQEYVSDPDVIALAGLLLEVSEQDGADGVRQA